MRRALVGIALLAGGSAEARECTWADVSSTLDPISKTPLVISDCVELMLDHQPSDGAQKRIGDQGVFHLARALSTAHGGRLAKLTLLDQNIGPAGAAELGEMLKTNTVLRSLDLGDNQIGSGGSGVLAEALLENQGLTSLLAQVEDEGAESIIEALSCNEKGGSVEQVKGCKSKLASYVQKPEIQQAINSAVQAQAQLETQGHRQEQLQQPPSTAPNAGPTHPPPHLPPPHPPPSPPAAQHSPPSHSPPSHPPPASTVPIPKVVHPPANPPHHPPATGTESERKDVLAWLAAHHLSEVTHLPLLTALGVQRVSGRHGSLGPLKWLAFADLSEEIERGATKGQVTLPCAPRCAADKAALFEVLQEERRRAAPA
jgi:hypothetical protein